MIIGVGQAASEGVRKGEIVNMDDRDAQSIQSAISSREGQRGRGNP